MRSIDTFTAIWRIVFYCGCLAFSSAVGLAQPHVTKIEDGVQPPRLVYKVEPYYSEDARKARIEGSVLLSTIVDVEGLPTKITVVRSLHPGLDNKAIEALRQWRFTPGQKQGQPAAVLCMIEINFRLLSRPPSPLQPVKAEEPSGGGLASKISGAAESRGAAGSGMQSRGAAANSAAREQALYEFRYRSETGATSLLEEVVGQLSLGISGGRYKLKGARSGVRFPSQRIPEFVVLLKPGQDPSAVVQFVRMKPGRAERSAGVPKPGKKSKDEQAFVAERQGEGFRIGVGRLAPGEYCFSLIVSNEAYCFGVDP